LLLFPFKVKLQNTDFTGIDTLPAEACAEVWGF